MRALGKSFAAVAAGICLFLTAPGQADAKPAYAKAEEKSCGFCHVGKAGDQAFTDAGKFYGRNHTLKGFAEGTKRPANAAPEPAATAEKKGEPASTAMADPESPCPCGCPHCREGCPNDCPQWHGKDRTHPMRERMTGHLEEMKKAVSDLRESEKQMESLTDPQAFRAAVLEHLKKLDDLQESHRNHMEKMMGAGYGDMPGPVHRHCR
jgi:hypothetical protein